MSSKSAIQLIILIIIFIILGGVYLKYFSKEKIIVDQTLQQTEKEINVNSQNNNKNKAFFEIKYASVISIDPEVTEKKIISKIVLCDLQKIIYPKIKNIFLNLIEKSGYPNIKIEKEIDFEKMYNDKFN